MDSLAVNVLVLVVASIVLVRAATWLVHSISTISNFLKMSEFTIAFILMGIITSVPEISIAISSSLSGTPELTLGDALGSNLTDLTLIIAIPTLIAGGIRVRSIIARKDALFMAITALVPLIMLFDGVISQTDAFILIIFYVFYLYRLLSQRSYFSRFNNHVKKRTAIFEIVLFVTAIVLLFLASQLVVKSAINVSTILDVPLVAVGLVIVSIGTSLPELAHGLKAVSIHHEQQLMGDILGSVVANATLVLAIAALIHPIQVTNMVEVTITAIFLVVVIILFLVGVYTDKELSVREALVLLGLYILFILTQLGVEIVHKAAL